MQGVQDALPTSRTTLLPIYPYLQEGSLGFPLVCTHKKTECFN